MQRSLNILPFPHVIIFLRICTSVYPGAGHLSSFFLPGVGHCHAFSARPWGSVHKKVQMPGSVPGGGWAMLELTDALQGQQANFCLYYFIIFFV